LFGASEPREGKPKTKAVRPDKKFASNLTGNPERNESGRLAQGGVLYIIKRSSSTKPTCQISGDTVGRAVGTGVYLREIKKT